jgi:predicted lipoprotein with Yx(FWY)xxD motif
MRTFTTVSAVLAAAFIAVAGPVVAQPAKVADGVLVGANGLTLYTFDRDAPGSGKSACNGPCATAWPPLMATNSDKPSGAWTIVARDDGSRQWAYKGRPLHFYQQDTKAGDRQGDGIGGVWHAAKE